MQPGIYTDIPDSEYRALPFPSWTSVFTHMMTSPAICLKKMNEPDKPSPSQEIGTAAHTHLLEPHKWDEVVRVFPNGKTRDSKAWNEWAPKYEGTARILEWEKKMIEGWTERFQNHPLTKDILINAQKEQAYIFDIEGVRCKAKLDIAVGNCVLDYKTTSAESVQEFIRHAEKFKYRHQLCFYKLAWEYLNEQPLEWVGIVAMSKGKFVDDPQFCLNYHDSELQEDIEEIRALVRRFKECRDTNTWPGDDNVWINGITGELRA